MTTEVYVFALLGGLAVLALFGALLWIAGAEAYDMARHWRRERQWRYVDRLLERQERARAMAPLSTVEVPAPAPAPAPPAASSGEDMVLVPKGCQCQWEVGDSPCRVHGEDEEQAPSPPAPWSPGLGARCWLLDDATDPASGGRACTVVGSLTIDSAPMRVLRYDASDDLVLVSATDPRICRGEVAS